MALKIELWIREFEQDDFNLVYSAVRLLIRENRDFAPNIGNIREKMRFLSSPQELTEVEAWALVSKACENGYYGYNKEFAKLPPEVQRAVGRPEQLRDWSVVDMDTFQTVISSNFMRSYRTSLARERELSMIPADIRAMIQGAADKMKMLGEPT